MMGEERSSTIFASDVIHELAEIIQRIRFLEESSSQNTALLILLTEKILPAIVELVDILKDKMDV